VNTYFLGHQNLHQLFPTSRARKTSVNCAQQPVHPHPTRPLTDSQVKGITAPLIGAERLFGGNKTGPNRIQMHVVAHRAQMTAPAFIDNEGFVSTAKQMSKEPTLEVEPAYA
jgi:hypothetical protein